MKIVLTNKEVTQLYYFTKGLNSSEANKVFNALFTEDHIDLFEVSAVNNEIVLEMDEEVSVLFAQVLIKNNGLVSGLIEKRNSNILTLINTAKKCGLVILKDLNNVIIKARIILINKKSI